MFSSPILWVVADARGKSEADLLAAIEHLSILVQWSPELNPALTSAKRALAVLKKRWPVEAVKANRRRTSRR